VILGATEGGEALLAAAWLELTLAIAPTGPREPNIRALRLLGKKCHRRLGRSNRNQGKKTEVKPSEDVPACSRRKDEDREADWKRAETTTSEKRGRVRS